MTKCEKMAIVHIRDRRGVETDNGVLTNTITYRDSEARHERRVRGDHRYKRVECPVDVAADGTWALECRSRVP